jgi:hypothetical protein
VVLKKEPDAYEFKGGKYRRGGIFIFAVNTKIRIDPFIGFIFKITGEKLETSPAIQRAIQEEHLLLVTGQDDEMIPCQDILSFYKIIKSDDLYPEDLPF